LRASRSAILITTAFSSTERARVTTVKIGSPNSSRQNVLLAALPNIDFDILQPGLIQTELKQGTLLHEAGKEIDTVYFPHSGMISLLAIMEDGTAIETATIGREGVIGAMTGVGYNLSSTRAIAQLTGKGSKISAKLFRSAVSRSNSLRELIVNHKESLLIQVQYTAACNSLHTIESRLCRWILRMRDHEESDEIPITQEFLSYMLGVNRTSVTLAARSLQNAGLIRYKRGHIQILDRAGLEEDSCECYKSIRDKIALLLATQSRPSNV
jgi:CRP-like cAMP-binding protein